MMNTTMKLMAAAALTAMATTTYAQTLCVFDPLGSQGDNYSLMKDYAVAAKQWGGDISLKPYPDEKLAAADYKSGKCDSVAITSIRARSINEFIGTISAPTAIVSREQTKTILALMGNPKLAPDMIANGSEVAGVSSLGFAYIVTRDRSVNTLPELAKLRFGALSFDKVQRLVVERIGGTAVPMELSEVGSKFNSGQVDAVLVPAVAFKPLELNKGVGTKGAIVTFPVALMTLNVLINPDKFPDGYGQKSRNWFVSQIDRQMATVAKIERSIDPNYWSNVPANIAPGYFKLMREARIGFTKDGTYDKKMNGIMKKIRCRQDPTNYECPLKDE